MTNIERRIYHIGRNINRFNVWGQPTKTPVERGKKVSTFGGGETIGSGHAKYSTKEVTIPEAGYKVSVAYSRWDGKRHRTYEVNLAGLRGLLGIGVGFMDNRVRAENWFAWKKRQLFRRG